MPRFDDNNEPIIREPYARKEQLEKKRPPKRKPTVTPGVVANCERLNVRSRPNTASEVVNILDKDDLVRVFHNDSTNDFYKILMVRNDETIEGYCMKTFIEIK